MWNRHVFPWYSLNLGKRFTFTPLSCQEKKKDILSNFRKGQTGQKRVATTESKSVDDRRQDCDEDMKVMNVMAAVDMSWPFAVPAHVMK